MNPFDILEIRPGANPDEIKAAYHRLAKQWHPDRFSGAQKDEAEARFRAISEAFNMLKDPERRGWLEEEFAQSAQGAPLAAAAPENVPPPSNPMERTPDDWFREAQKAFSELDVERAQGLVQFAIRQDSSKAEYHLFLGKLLETHGSDRRAVIKAYEVAVKLNPKDIDTTVRLAEHFQSIGMHARAAAFLQKAREISPNHKALRKIGAAVAEPTAGKSGALDPKGLGGLGDQAKSLFNKIMRRG